MKHDISGQIFQKKKKTQISNFMIIRPVGAEPFLCARTDGRTDIHQEANSRSSQFFERD